LNLVYVCLCHGVTEKEVRAVIGDGAATVEDVGDETLAGTGCGGCQERIGWILKRMSAAESEPQHAAPHMSVPHDSKGISS
jgi:bacterioferritin-associated ferredoxin